MTDTQHSIGDVAEAIADLLDTLTVGEQASMAAMAGDGTDHAAAMRAALWLATQRLWHDGLPGVTPDAVDTADPETAWQLITAATARRPAMHDSLAALLADLPAGADRARVEPFRP